jgi:hypothetical protein
MRGNQPLCGLWALLSNEQNVLKAVAVEFRHGRKVVRERLAFACLERWMNCSMA